MTDSVDILVTLCAFGAILFFLKHPYFNTKKSKPISQTIIWINAIHSILTSTYGGNVRMYGGEPRTDKSKEAWRKSLEYWWGITNRDELFNMIESLVETRASKNVAAWDYSRAFSLLSMGYIAQYITRDEALDNALRIAKRVQPLYRSWDDFFEGYFKGYERWSGESGAKRREIYQNLKDEKNSIFNTPWNLKLKKDW